MMRLAILGLVFLQSTSGFAKGVKIKTLDDSGAAFPNVLVIVRSLETGKEVGRYLSNANGETPEIQMRDRLNQIIATCPYGLCRTAVEEFSTQTVTEVLTVCVPVISTDDHILIGAPKAEVVVSPVPLAQEGNKPALFVRDPMGMRENWYEVGSDGRVKVELVDDHTYMLFVVGSQIFQRYLIAADCKAKSVDAQGFKCIHPDNGPIQVRWEPK